MQFLSFSHEKCEEEVEARLLFESKIKRPYFHVKPLDAKQLKNWSAYLDFEIKLGVHERIVVLFERCLIPCAKYEVCFDNMSKVVETFLDLSKQSEAVLLQCVIINKSDEILASWW
jgi:hypothetical protein